MVNLKNLNLILVVDCKKTIEKAKQNRNKFNNLLIKNRDNFIEAFLNSNTNIDIIILDLDYVSSINLSPIINMNKNQQFIFLASKRQVYIKFLNEFNGGSSMILFKPIKFSAILDNIILIFKNNDKKLTKLTKQISIDLKTEKIFENKNEIFLSPIMHKLIILFSANLGSIVTFEMIEECIYNTQYVTKITIQNLVGNLRRKLNLNITNIYATGYVLNEYKICPQRDSNSRPQN
ncbi:hypothetical protein CSPARA_1087 [Campylobacter sputorum bv. paraureolyticus LMG 11764]|nr:hypothetical protein CSPARA_1087 [Campylobacter sputorum bv. paraureolyticus LMG 11764]